MSKNKLVKLEHFVDAPAKLDMSFLCGDASEPAPYDLESSVLHVGTANFGHYFGIHRAAEGWVEKNDCSTKLISEGDMLKKTRAFAILLVYRRALPMADVTASPACGAKRGNEERTCTPPDNLEARGQAFEKERLWETPAKKLATSTIEVRPMDLSFSPPPQLPGPLCEWAAGLELPSSFVEKLLAEDFRDPAEISYLVPADFLSLTGGLKMGVRARILRCKHCQHTLPEFEMAAKMIDNAAKDGQMKALSAHPKYFLLQCDKSPEERKICDAHPGSGLPMMKLFRDQHELSFSGDRWARKIAEWSIHVSRPVLLKVETKKDLEKSLCSAPCSW